MTFDTTYGNLKKRIFEILEEYTHSSDTVFVSDGDKELINSRIPDVVNSSLIRMYESLPIGTEQVIQRINDFSPIAYDRGIPDGDRTTIEFTTPTANMAVFFTFFGSGKVSFYNDSGKVVGTIDCSGTSTLMTKRVYLSFANAGLYSVGVSGTVKIMDFTVYANDGRTNVNALCSVFEVSFELPKSFESFILVKANDTRIDNENIVVGDGYAFMQKSSLGTAETLSVQYKKKPDIVSDTTDDSFVFDISPLAFEALVCIAASEVCREQDTAKHTRLVYKYNDLCEGLRSCACEKQKRNTFFKASRKMRW